MTALAPSTDDVSQRAHLRSTTERGLALKGTRKSWHLVGFSLAE